MSKEFTDKIYEFKKLVWHTLAESFNSEEREIILDQLCDVTRDLEKLYNIEKRKTLNINKRKKWEKQ
jgi:hypothetical protein